MAVFEEVHTESSQPESATTLRTIVDLVRRITNADVASIVSFSLTDHTVTWKAVSGFGSHMYGGLIAGYRSPHGGVPADSLARIFDPFFSLKGPGKEYGLGLAICLDPGGISGRGNHG